MGNGANSRHRELSPSGLKVKKVSACTDHWYLSQAFGYSALQIQSELAADFIRVTRGAIWDVALDLRPESPTYLQHHGELLSADKYVEVTWASHVDLKTGRPVEIPGARSPWTSAAGYRL